MPDKSAKPLLIFDLGNVIVPYDDNLLKRNMAARCRRPAEATRDIGGYFNRDWNALQTGKMQDEELYKKIVDGLGFKGDFQDFQHVWCSHIGRDRKMEALVTDLAQSHTVVVLSNSTRTHWDHYNNHYPVLGKLDGLYASHLLGVVKPEPEIFHEVLRAQERKPEEAIFIDDIPRMVAGAEATGMKGVVFTGYDDLVAELAALGVHRPARSGSAPARDQPRRNYFLPFLKGRESSPAAADAKLI